ncbi:hypothetical protein [Amycolatopsis jiangsuensis]|uniref:Uncharacterized protein n=1 Tax=Amycolatopsis jiangsuensis TaxID=1181879 RepID=A0A840IPS5_9PSEU|nr:hypothetical protein [Amycolatopsis jiangsuensis]MBB4683559.1 hypothetical protein [Amycolatopsis jiangsuensis]
MQPDLDELEPVMIERGMSESYVKDFVRLTRLVNAGALAEVTTAVADLTGNPPRSLDAFLAEHRDQLREGVDASFYAQTE